MKRNILAVIGCCLCCVCCFGCAMSKLWATNNQNDANTFGVKFSTQIYSHYPLKTGQEMELCIPYHLILNQEEKDRLKGQKRLFPKYLDGYLLIKPPPSEYPERRKETYQALNRVLNSPEDFDISSISVLAEGDSFSPRDKVPEDCSTIVSTVISKIPEVQIVFDTETKDYSSNIIPVGGETFFSPYGNLLTIMVDKAWLNKFNEYFDSARDTRPVAWLDSQGQVIESQGQLSASDYRGLLLKVEHRNRHGVRYIKILDNILRFSDVRKHVYLSPERYLRFGVSDLKTVNIKEHDISDWHLLNYPVDIEFNVHYVSVYKNPLWMRIIGIPVALACDVVTFPFFLLCPYCYVFAASN